MKKIIISLLAIAVLGTSCQDFLDEKVYTQITNDYIISTPSGMASAVVALYTKDREMFRDNSDTESTLATCLLIGDDITVPRAGAGTPQFGRYSNMNPTNAQVKRLWSHLYAIVGYANTIISAEDKVDMTDPVAIQALAEAKAFRAHAYFWLLRKFDRIYLNMTATTPENLDAPRVYKPALEEDVYGLINSDLQYAINHLSWNTNQPGRFTQGVVRHIKAKVAMCQKNFEQAAHQVDTIVDSGKYNLVDLSKVFEGADLNHSEAIFVSQWSKGTGGWYISPSTGTTSGHRLPLHFTPTYNMEQGMMMTFEMGGYPWGRIFPNNYLTSLYDKQKDKRYQQFFRHYFTYNNPDGLPRGKKVGDTIFAASKAQYLNVHPCITKYNDSWTRLTPSEMQSYKPIILYRLAETYLMGAEAYLEIGNTSKALDYYNKTWERAGHPKFSGVLTMDMILDEHARELCMEGDRWFLLKRRGLLVDRVREFGGEYLTNSKGVVLNDDTLARVNIQPFHVRLPIPQAQIDIMGRENFPQNDGY